MDQEHLVKCSISFKYIFRLCTLMCTSYIHKYILFACLWHFLDCNSQNLLFQLWDRIKLCKAFVFFLLTIRHWNVPVHHHRVLWDIVVSRRLCSGLRGDAWWDPLSRLGGSGSRRHWGEPNWWWKTLGGPDWHRKGLAGVGAGTGPIAAWRPGLWSCPRRPSPEADALHWSWPGPTGNVSIPADMKSWDRKKKKHFRLYFCQYLWECCVLQSAGLSSFIIQKCYF